jgi:hypothetical protein
VVRPALAATFRRKRGTANSGVHTTLSKKSHFRAGGVKRRSRRRPV